MPNPNQHLAQAQNLIRNGQFLAAEPLFRQMLAARPRNIDALLGLGIVCNYTNRAAEAIDFLKNALALQPYFIDALANLAYSYLTLKRHEEAIASFRKALLLKPADQMLLHNLGITLGAAGQYEEAIPIFRRAIALKPDDPDIHYNLGNALRSQLKHDEAIAAYKEALRHNPKHFQAYNNLGHAFKAKYQYDEALTHFRHALALNPQFTESLAALADTLRDLGQVQESLPIARQVLDLTPNDPLARSVWLYTQEYLPNQNPSAIFEEYKKWGQRHSPATPSTPVHPNDPAPDRRLRIGYVSPDLRKHAVASFFENLLESHDPAVVETFCYSDTPYPDAVTARLQSLSRHWRHTSKFSTDQFAQAVRDDHIDILVDLAGHTAGNRLLAFAKKLAPIQITYLGYPVTTGLPAMDYRFTDALADPPALSDPFHTEKLIRLPNTFLNFRPDPDAPPLAPLPALTSAHITFGSFNVLPKITPDMIQIWSRILQQIPSAKLLLKNHALQSPTARNRLLSLFAQSQIDPTRIDLRERIKTTAGHLALYNQIDIALDTFPYHGTTTTCEALWMGVPVISLIGQRHVSRVGLSLLTSVGLPQLAAPTPEQYIAAATKLAADLPSLARLRASLRTQMQSSPLMDKATFARNVESAYRNLWHRWCSDNQPASPPTS